MKHKAVIDRIVDDNHAVLLVGVTEKEFILPVVRLPFGSSEGTWLKVEITDTEITDLEFDDIETNKTKNRIDYKLALLRKKKGSQFRIND